MDDNKCFSPHRIQRRESVLSLPSLDSPCFVRNFQDSRRLSLRRRVLQCNFCQRVKQEREQNGEDKSQTSAAAAATSNKPRDGFLNFRITYRVDNRAEPPPTAPTKDWAWRGTTNFFRNLFFGYRSTEHTPSAPNRNKSCDFQRYSDMPGIFVGPDLQSVAKRKQDRSHKTTREHCDSENSPPPIKRGRENRVT